MVHGESLHKQRNTTRVTTGGKSLHCKCTTFFPLSHVHVAFLIKLIFHRFISTMQRGFLHETNARRRRAMIAHIFWSESKAGRERRLMHTHTHTQTCTQDARLKWSVYKVIKQTCPCLVWLVKAFYAYPRLVVCAAQVPSHNRDFLTPRTFL